MSKHYMHLPTSQWGRDIDMSSSQATSYSMTLIMLYQKDKGTSFKIFILNYLRHVQKGTK